MMHPTHYFCSLTVVAAINLLGIFTTTSALAQKILLDGSFEQGNTSGWSLFVPDSKGQKIANLGIENKDAHSGSFAAAVDCMEPQRLALISKPFPLQGGEQVRFSAWVKADEQAELEAGKPGPVLRLLFYTDDNARTPNTDHARMIGTNHVLRRGPSAYSRAGRDLLPKKWTKLEMLVDVPEGTKSATANAFTLGVTGRVLWDDIRVETLSPGETVMQVDALAPDPLEDASIQTAVSRLPQLHAQTIRLLEESQKNNPEVYNTVLDSIIKNAQTLMKESLIPVDMSRVINAPYASFNRDIWRYRSLAENLFAAALAYTAPGSPEQGNRELLQKAIATFEWLLAHANEYGDCQAPDPNINRFHYVPAWEALVLLEDKLPANLRQRFLRHLLRAARFQIEDYGAVRNGSYPNMDSAYALIMQQAGSLFDRNEFTDQVNLWIERLGSCMVGTAWDYSRGWNHQPSYTNVTLNYAGRLYQLSGSAALLSQIAAHADHFKYFLEQNGIMDFGMGPFFKHAWMPYPWSATSSSLELTHRYAPTAQMQLMVDHTHEAIVRTPWILYTPYILYWVAPDTGERAQVPANFVRPAPEIRGFQARHSNDAGTITAYANGTERPTDTRVSAILSTPDNADNTLLAGVLVEIIKDGSSWFIGDRAPQVNVSVEAPEQTTESSQAHAALKVSQYRHNLGARAEPMIIGNEWTSGAIKRWEFDVWRGGNPESLPIRTDETWSWLGDRMEGRIVFDVLEDIKVDALRVSLAIFNTPGTQELIEFPRGVAVRTGRFCFMVEALAGDWEVPAPGTAEDFDWRVDVPPGEYVVTIVSGDRDHVTDPFDIKANGSIAKRGISAPKGEAATETFKVNAADGSIRLNFLPQQTGNHWKVNSLRIASAGAVPAYERTFNVGKEGDLGGGNLYTPASGFGWKVNMMSQMRERGGNTPVSTLLTSPVRIAQAVFTDTNAGEQLWKQGKRSELKIIFGIGDSLAQWLAENNSSPGPQR